MATTVLLWLLFYVPGGRHIYDGGKVKGTVL